MSCRALVDPVVVGGRSAAVGSDNGERFGKGCQRSARSARTSACVEGDQTNPRRARECVAPAGAGMVTGLAGTGA